ncbi:hypothetical protein C8Q73DRAFT_16095 [Cubamyces lactineus]|nr:hypothetical protein C8Q73DRAFT_16095 [Cubamyces lactineus]
MAFFYERLGTPPCLHLALPPRQQTPSSDRPDQPMTTDSAHMSFRAWPARSCPSLARPRPDHNNLFSISPPSPSPATSHLLRLILCFLRYHHSPYDNRPAALTRPSRIRLRCLVKPSGHHMSLSVLFSVVELRISKVNHDYLSLPSLPINPGQYVLRRPPLAAAASSLRSASLRSRLEPCASSALRRRIKSEQHLARACLLPRQVP